MGGSQSTCDKKVVIIGGGVAGMGIAAAVIKAGAKPVVIDTKDKFWHAIGSPRGLAVAGWGAKLAVPYTKVLDGVKGTFIQGSASGLDPVAKTVTVTAADGSTITQAFDYCVLATGINHGSPVQAAGASTADAVASLAALQTAVAGATNVVIVGGGPVGVEAAGEVKAAFPTKNVTLVHSGPRLLHSKVNGNLPESFGATLKTKLEKAGVTVLLGQRVEKGTAAPEGATAAGGGWVGAHTLTTSTGTSLPSDVTLFFTSGRPNTAWLSSTPLASALTENGFVKVTPTLSVEGHEGVIFACGDITAGSDPKMAAVATLKHVPVVAGNLKALIKASAGGKAAPTLKQHKPVTGPLMFVTIGPKAGAGIFGSHTFGNKMVAMAKGGDLFTSKTAKDFGFKKAEAYVSA